MATFETKMTAKVGGESFTIHIKLESTDSRVNDFERALPYTKQLVKVMAKNPLTSTISDMDAMIAKGIFYCILGNYKAVDFRSDLDFWIYKGYDKSTRETVTVRVAKK